MTDEEEYLTSVKLNMNDYSKLMERERERKRERERERERVRWRERR